MKNLTRKNIMALVCIIAITLFGNVMTVNAETVKKVTVDTQKELNSALGNKNVTSITIKTNKKVNLTIPNKSYTSKSVYVKAPNATIKNNGKFKSVNVYVTTQVQLDKALANTTMKYTYLTISTNESKKLVVSGNYAKVGLIVNTPNAEVVNKANFKTVNVYVNSQAQLEKVLKDSKVTTITITTNEAIELTISEGNFTNVKLVVNAPKATIINNGKFKDTIVNNGKVTVPEVTPSPEPTTPVTPSTTPADNNGGGSTVPVVPTPTQPTEPTVPVTPTPVPVDPTPTPVEPTKPPVTLDELKVQRINEIKTEANALFSYMTFNEWNDFNKLVNEWITRLNSYTSVQDLESNFVPILDSLYKRQQDTVRFVNNDPYDTSVLTPDQLVNNFSHSIINGMFDFNILDEAFGVYRHYHVTASDPALVNNITFKNATVSVTSGSAITYDIDGWNNITGEQDIVGIYVLEDSATPGQYNIGAELVRNVDYHITENAIIIDGSVTKDLDVGHYGFFIKTVVPYLNANTGNYNYFNIIN